jgi:hypothetical protein
VTLLRFHVTLLRFHVTLLPSRVTLLPFRVMLLAFRVTLLPFHVMLLPFSVTPLAFRVTLLRSHVTLLPFRVTLRLPDRAQQPVLDGAHFDLGNVRPGLAGIGGALSRVLVCLELVLGLERAHPDELVLGSIRPGADDFDAKFRAGGHDLLVEQRDPRIEHAAVDRVNAYLCNHALSPCQAIVTDPRACSLTVRMVSGARFFYRDAAAPRPNRPMNVGVLALIERDGRLLLECRSDCGRWGLIGGGLDAGGRSSRGCAAK